MATFRIVSDDREMSRVPATEAGLFTLLKERHAILMGGRPDLRPGEFKRERNQAGATMFVAPDLVVGTLSKGDEFSRLLPTAFQRAVFIAFLVTEVHPFADGNGRIARVMMNAELHQAGEHRIIIPTGLRNEYVAALKGLSHNANPEAFIQVMSFAQQYTSLVDHENFEAARETYRRTHAFVEVANGPRLTLPTYRTLSHAHQAKTSDSDLPTKESEVPSGEGKGRTEF